MRLTVELATKLGCIFPMVIVSILPHTEFGPNDHWEDAPHFKILTRTYFSGNAEGDDALSDATFRTLQLVLAYNSSDWTYG